MKLCANPAVDTGDKVEWVEPTPSTECGQRETSTTTGEEYPQKQTTFIANKFLTCA